MSVPDWSLDERERAVLEAALDALLPPSGSFPLPSRTGLIDDFILRRVPADSQAPIPYPGLDAAGLRAILARLGSHADVVEGLRQLEADEPDTFTALWRLAVYGYYSRPETIVAIQRDLAPAYHGAPLPLGYAHAIEPWDPADPLQLPPRPRGSYIPTTEVRRVAIERLPNEEDAS